MRRVYRVNGFSKQTRKLFSSIEIDELTAFIEQLKIGSTLGKPLSYHFLREKKIGSKRVYFLIYDDFDAVLLVAVSKKKTQQATIDAIKAYLDEYRRYVKRISTQ